VAAGALEWLVACSGDVLRGVERCHEVQVRCKEVVSSNVAIVGTLEVQGEVS